MISQRISKQSISNFYETFFLHSTKRQHFNFLNFPDKNRIFSGKTGFFAGKKGTYFVILGQICRN